MANKMSRCCGARAHKGLPPAISQLRTQPMRWFATRSHQNMSFVLSWKLLGPGGSARWDLQLTVLCVRVQDPQTVTAVWRVHNTHRHACTFQIATTESEWHETISPFRIVHTPSPWTRRRRCQDKLIRGSTHCFNLSNMLRIGTCAARISMASTLPL